VTVVDFAFTDEQEDLRAAVRRLLARSGAQEWTKMVDELGLTALAIPEEHGGFGASLVEVAIALEETGAALAPVPLLATVTAAAAVDPSTPAGAALLPGLAAGSTVAALAFPSPTGPPLTAVRDGNAGAGAHLVDGTAVHVLNGADADIAVVATDSGLFAVPVAYATRTVHPTLDQTRSQATLVFEAAPAERVGSSAGPALSLLRAALAVESVGVARAALAAAVAHLQTREQFGVPLATFQALRHRVADLTVHVEAATSSAWYAVRVAGTDEFATAATVAKLVATEAAFAVTGECIQLFGGIGFTWEQDAHRYFKRATANRLLAGTPAELRRELVVPATGG
jgi:alkylation response protein AidB-like acyl-CoA dehydrogenase